MATAQASMGPPRGQKKEAGRVGPSLDSATSSLGDFLQARPLLALLGLFPAPIKPDAPHQGGGLGQCQSLARARAWAADELASSHVLEEAQGSCPKGGVIFRAPCRGQCCPEAPSAGPHIFARKATETAHWPFRNKTSFSTQILYLLVFQQRVCLDSSISSVGGRCLFPCRARLPADGRASQGCAWPPYLPTLKCASDSSS